MPRNSKGFYGPRYEEGPRRKTGGEDLVPRRVAAGLAHSPGVREVDLRDDFSGLVKRKLAERVGFVCSNPDCEASTMGPSSRDAMTMNVGVAGHITAASPKGPRYNGKLTTRQRKAFRNGIWLCEVCGKIVDADESAHSVRQLLTWKQRAEHLARTRLGVPKANSHFHLLPNDQTMYINVRRFQELAQRDHLQINAGPLKENAPLLNMEGLVGYVMENERALKTLYPEALLFDRLKTKTDLENSRGQLISFVGKFRSKNAPRLRNGRVPIIHPTGNINKDHVAYKNYNSIRLVLPLDSLWYASQSAVAFFRGLSRIAVRGLARVHSVTSKVIVASPIWLALPGRVAHPFAHLAKGAGFDFALPVSPNRPTEGHFKK